MTAVERQAIIDLAQLQINQYFDHYLTEVFPKQIGQIMVAHNQDAEAHQVRLVPLIRSKRKIDRLIWMVIGGSAVVGFVSAFIIQHWSDISKLLF